MSHMHDHHHRPEDESAHYRTHSPHHRPARRSGGSELDHRHVSRPDAVGDFVSRRLIPTIMDRSNRPLKVIMNFGEMKLDDGDESPGNAIVYNAPGSTLRVTGQGSATDGVIVDSDALRRRIARDRELSYTTLPAVSARRRIALDDCCLDGRCDQECRGRPIPRSERLIGFERGGGRSQRNVGICVACQLRKVVGRKGYCERCEHRLFRLPGRKGPYEYERDEVLEYSSPRIPIWVEEVSEVSYRPRARESRYGGCWSERVDGYDADILRSRRY